MHSRVSFAKSRWVRMGSFALAVVLGFGCTSSDPSGPSGGLGGGGAASDDSNESRGSGGILSSDPDGSGGRALAGGGGSGGNPELCAEEGACECPAKFGVFLETGECFSCSPAPSCGGSGETGRLLATAPVDGGGCVCETKPGYFPGSEGSIAEKCDADGDGWVSDRAQPSIESSNAVLRDNARCDVRRVRSFFLENEAGQTYDVAAEESEEDLTIAFPGGDGVPAGLPLYESSRNDVDAESELPFYGAPRSGRRLKPEEVNSLTKACIGATVDTNDNGITDVEEWSGHKTTRTFANKKLESYYEKYTEFGYFLALHDGFWEPAGDSGVYRIVERRRSNSGASASTYQVPLVYPDGTPDYSMECKRHADALFPWSGDELNAQNTVGGDFARFSDAEMFHHSQFKCVQVTTKAGYGSATAASHPSLVYLEGGEVVRKEGSSSIKSKWTINECFSLSSTPAGTGTNTVIPEISCAPAGTEPESGSVRWAAVDYQHYTAGYTSPQNPGGYSRGCANECADEGAAPNECWGCSEASWGQSITKPEGAPCGDGESCDGAGECSGCLAGVTQCQGSTVQQICSDEREWVDNVSCQYGCYPALGACYPECVPGAKRCSDAGTPQTCTDTGHWSSGSACAANTSCLSGNCLLNDGRACSTSNQCFTGTCTQFFEDGDGDGYGGTTVVRYCGTNPPAGATTDDDDCCDADFDAKPGQTGYFDSQTECGGYDYNCSGTAERKYPSMHACNCTDSPPGWIISVPACGMSGKFGTCHRTSGTDCHPIAPGNATQSCR